MTTDMILIYVTCDCIDEAKKIGKHLMQKKLCTCVNIFPEMQPMFLWPPKSGIIDESKEIVLIIKTLDSKWDEIESEILKIHSYETPCIFSIPVGRVSKKYYDWLIGEME